MFEGARSADIQFDDYCAALTVWLASAPEPEAALIAAADLLRAREHLSEDEARWLLASSADIHAALGAGVILDLRQICAEYRA